MLARILRGNTHRHIVGNDGDFAFEIDAPGFVTRLDIVARAQEGIGPALIHQRIGPETVGQDRAAGAPHQFHMVHIGGPVGPLIGTRQGRFGLRRIEVEYVLGGPVIHTVGEHL